MDHGHQGKVRSSQDVKVGYHGDIFDRSGFGFNMFSSRLCQVNFTFMLAKVTMIGVSRKENHIETLRGTTPWLCFGSALRLDNTNTQNLHVEVSRDITT